MAFASLTVDMNANFAALRTDFAAAVAASQAANQKMKDHLKDTERAAKASGEGISKAFESIKSVLGAVGLGLGVGEIISQFKDVTQSVLDIGKASEKTGIQVEALSGLKLAAESVEVPFDQLVSALTKFDKALDISNPALIRLGFSLKEIKALAADPAGALGKIAEKFVGMADSAGKATIASDLFGKNLGSVMIPFLNLGSKGLAEFQEQAKQLGTVITQELLAKFKQFDDEMDKLKAGFDGFKISIVSGALPALTSFIEQINEGIRIFGSFGAAFANIAIRTSPFASNAEDIEKLRDDLAKLKAELADFQDDNTAHSREAIPLVEAEIKNVTKTLEYVLFVQRQLALAGTQAGAVLDSLDAKAKRIAPKDTAPDRTKDPSGVSAKIKAELAAAIALEKENASERLTVLDDAHKQGLISEQAFYAERTAIAKRELGANLDAINRAIKEEKSALAKATPEQKDQVEAKLITLLGQRAVVTKQLAFVEVKSRQEETAAVKTLLDATAQLNIEELKSQGRTEEAAIKEGALFKAQKQRAELVNNFKGGESSEEVKAFDRAQIRAERQGRLNQLQRDANVIRDEELAKEENINAVVELSGHSIDAELHAIDATNEARRVEIELLTRNLNLQLASAEAAKDPALVAQLQLQLAALNAQTAKLDPAVVSLQKFEVAQSEVSDVTRRASIEEQHIQNLRTTGSITTLELLSRTDEARKREVVQLTIVRDKLAAIAKLPADFLKLAELNSEIETLEANANQLGHVFEDVFESSATQALTDFIDGTQSADEAFKSFLKNVLHGLSAIASQAISQQIFGGATGNGGWLSALFAVGGAAAGSSGGGSGGNFSGRMAEGGITSGITMAGEAGPEAVIPLSSERTVPVSLSAGTDGGPEAVIPLSGGRTVPVSLKSSVKGGTEELTSVLQGLSRPGAVIPPSGVPVSLKGEGGDPFADVALWQPRTLDRSTSPKAIAGEAGPEAAVIPFPRMATVKGGTENLLTSVLQDLSRPEAVIPLSGGRTIPVTLKNSAGTEDLLTSVLQGLSRPEAVIQPSDERAVPMDFKGGTEGGITSGRTLAGEAGPEAVIPLSGDRVPVSLKDSDEELTSVLQDLSRTQKITQQIFGRVYNSSIFTNIATSLAGSAGSGGFSARMAEGGITSGRTLAGEAGPEAVIPLSGGRTVPVKIQGGAATNVYMTVVTPDANSFRQSSLQTTNQLNAQLQRAQARK